MAAARPEDVSVRVWSIDETDGELWSEYGMVGYV